ncbi:MAG: hypothetical protein KA354_12565 [Phycisphaerae bacterium]|nr:hypothetical protein [Phycisphaerae bacterium]
MQRFTIALALAVPAWTLATLTGCGSEVRSYQSSERIEQAEPRMVSPGSEALVPDRVEQTEPRMVSPGTEVLVPDRVE